MLSNYASALRESTPAKELIYSWMKEKFNLEWDFKNAPLAYRPIYVYTYYNIDTKSNICDIYSTRYGYDWYKINESGVVEYYTQSNVSEFRYVSYDINTMLPLEKYKRIDHLTEHKYDLDMNLLQVNNSINNEIPDSWLADIEDFKFKAHIIAWSEKPYGRIVEYCGVPTF